MSEQLLDSKSLEDLDAIYLAIRNEGFSDRTIKLIDNYISQILNGKTNLTQFNQTEHAGLC